MSHLLFVLGWVMAAVVAWGEDGGAGKTVIACVGDSITEMKGRPSGKTYPQLLQDRLGPRFEVLNFGKSGSCVLRKSDHPYWDEEVFRKFLGSRPDIVIIGLGTNDSRPNNWARKSEFPGDYRALLDVAGNLASKPVVVVALPLPMLTYPGKWQYCLVAETIADGVVPAVRQVAEAKGCAVIDFFNEFPAKHDSYIDGVHPSDAGLQQMATIAARTVKAVAAERQKALGEKAAPSSAGRQGHE